MRFSTTKEVGEVCTKHRWWGMRYGLTLALPSWEIAVLVKIEGFLPGSGQFVAVRRS